MKTVNISLGVSEEEQEGSFQNATLQGAGDSLAFSIATRLKVPESVAAEGETAVAQYLQDALTLASRVVEGLEFEVQIGASRDAQHIARPAA